MRRIPPSKVLFAAVASVGLALLAGCARDGSFQPYSMWNQSKLRPLSESPMPGEQSVSRPIPVGAVAVGQLPPDDPVATGRIGNRLVTSSPVPVTPAMLARGQDRFDVYCSPCHGRLGDGNGRITQRGFPHPPDYAIPRLRQAPLGHFFDVVSNGYGAMYSYASRVPINDRWAIASYIRVLQASRPVVQEQFQQQRERARQTGIGTLPVRPIR
jgi:mono/diheme cytochrome c family protein